MMVSHEYDVTYQEIFGIYFIVWKDGIFFLMKPSYMMAIELSVCDKIDKKSQPNFLNKHIIDS